MSNRLSSIAWFIGTILGAIVVVGGVQTSSASFAGATSNRSNLWRSADLAIEIDVGDQGGDSGFSEDLFLNAEGLYPGIVLENCIPISVESTLDQLRVRMHGESVSGDLGPYLNIGIELGSAGEGCTNFQPDEEVFAGNLAQLTSDHGSFATGLALNLPPSDGSYLRFTGSVADTDDAQSREAEYVIHVEARP